MKLRTSSLVILPSLPVAGTFAKSMPCYFAIALVAGVANTPSDDYTDFYPSN